MGRAAALLLALCLAACGGSGGDSPPATNNNPPQQATLRTLSVPSSQVGLTYEVTVYTPAGYATSTNQKPIIYALDHELQFGVVRQFVELLGIDAIIVSVGNLGAPRRFIDFDLPGAEAYMRFLTLELIPLIEAQYRVDRTRRTLMGYSLSGLAAVITLLEENPSNRYFSGYVITDPSLQFHTQELYTMEQRMWDTSHSLPVTAHHCSTIGTGPYADFPNKLVGRGYQGAHYQFRTYTLDHGAVLGPCVQEGLRYVFGLG
jgi:predicted alpha/beta superfamily hydrolase